MKNLATKILVAAFLLAPQSLAAQVSSYVCKFDIECSPNEGCQKKEMDLTFFLDGQGKAFMQGNVGLVQVVPVAGTQAFSFVEPLESGVVQSTTVLTDGTAVHSRHTAIMGDFVVAQWHGNCSN
ncbi:MULTISPECIES: hypothetical protein [Ruegeria]|uniref:hypothetical protein n=1 Tax=Ruegeria TaxID=97050 RepID=UPI00147C1DED|nr:MULTISPECIES: hypothetical protein [Ruegeria]